MRLIPADFSMIPVDLSRLLSRVAYPCSSEHGGALLCAGSGICSASVPAVHAGSVAPAALAAGRRMLLACLGRKHVATVWRSVCARAAHVCQPPCLPSLFVQFRAAGSRRHLGDEARTHWWVKFCLCPACPRCPLSSGWHCRCDRASVLCGRHLPMICGLDSAVAGMHSRYALIRTSFVLAIQGMPTLIWMPHSSC